MLRQVTFAATLALAALGGNAEAAQTFTFQGVSVDANTGFPGLEIKTAQVAATGTTFTLNNVGDSFTFTPLFDIWTNERIASPNDFVDRTITADISFNPPAGGNGTVGGITDTRFRFAGLVTAGRVEWNDPILVTAANGAQYSLDLSDEFFNGFVTPFFNPGRANGAGVDLTVTLQAQPVPEPGTLAAGALGVLMCSGGWYLRRKRAA